MKKVIVVIPAYNEALSIESVVADIKKNAPEADYVIVNDGSKDNTKEVVEKRKFNCISCFLNLGLFGAVQTGFLYALENGYDIAIQFDGDGQHDAKYINDLVKSVEEGNNIAIGSRFVAEKKPFTSRMIGSRLISFAIFLVTGKRISDPTSGFRAYDREVIADYALDMNNPPEPDTLVLMLRKKKKIKEVQVQMKKREYGESYLNLSNTIRYMSRMMISILLIQPLRKVK